jgi:hypothetical protein
VIATDLVDYASPDQDAARRDFLLEGAAPEGVECIVTNPPYKLADEFVAHALRLCPRVFMLLRLAFLESTGRSNILDCGRLARVYVFRNRVRMMHRANWDGPRISAGSLAFAWFCWSRGHAGDAVIRRISWRPLTLHHATDRRLPPRPANLIPRA